MKEISEIWWNPGKISYKRKPNNPEKHICMPIKTVRGNLETAMQLAMINQATLHIDNKFVASFTSPLINHINRKKAEDITHETTRN